ncbi:MAG: EAL domain-containing protein [Eubacteriales bacterium]|nr:EAL domain-containing protein [Eubacteriales bacterium]
METQALEDGGYPKNQARVKPLTILLPIVLLLVIILVLIIGSLFARSYVFKQAQDFLDASAQEQATTLRALLGSQAETLSTAAYDFAEHCTFTDASIFEHLDSYVKNSLFLHVCFAMPDGVCYVDDGAMADVSSRAYFKEAMAGRWSVQRIDDPISHDGSLIILGVPVYRDGDVIGVLHGGYRSDMLEEMISPDVFGGAAYSVICAPDGDVVIGARADAAVLAGENVFSALETVELQKDFTVERLKEDVHSGKSGAFFYAAPGGERYVVYIPLQIGGAEEQWALFNAVPASVVYTEVNRITKNYVLLAVCIILAFSAVFFYFILRENRALRLLKHERDQLLASEEQNRIGMRESGLNLARYDLNTKEFYTNSEYAVQQGYSTTIQNVPDEFIQAGLVAPECVDEYRAFYDKLRAGESASVMSALKVADGSFRWFQMKADFLYDADNKPYMAIILFQDANEQREKNAFYAKWQQSLERRDPKSFTLFRCNLSKCSSFDRRDGALISLNFSQANKPFNERTREYAGRYVHLDDFDVYVEIVNSEYLLASYYRGKTTVSLDYRERLAEDTFRYLRLTIEMVQYPDSEDIEAFLMYEDINKLKEQELAAKSRAAFDPLKEEKNRLRALDAYLQLQSGERSKYSRVFENAETVVVEYDWANDAFSYALNIGDHIYGKFDARPLWQILLSDMVADAADVKKLQEMVRTLIMDAKAKSTGMDVRLKTPERVKHWFSVHAVRGAEASDTAGKIILTFMDINDEVLSDEKLRYHAEHDMLTGLYNRSAFLKAIDKAVKDNPGDSFMLLCCDINNFRLINARFGRLEGDKLLQYSAERFLVYAEMTHGLTGRLSNDVFALLLPNMPGLLEKTTDAVQSFFEGYPLNVKITGRAGAYIISDPDMNVDMMLDCASVAKESIRGKYTQCLALFDESMNEQAVLEKDIADRMEAALAEGQFDVYIQPQFNHATGQIVGAEALVRWIDPQRGVISPGVFIPVFEKNGFITKMDEYVWERTARYLGAWIEKGNEPVPISVNVSREDTNDPALCDKLIAIVDRYKIPRNLFRLEITETMFAEDTERLTAVVRQLQQSGFLVEMDDFGSGYSSLNVLKDVPVDVLKLDMRFFSGKDSYERGGMIINAVLRMSRWLGISTIAEGVEDKEQADFLLSVGCATIQGYLYAKPMPVTNFERKCLESRSMPFIAQDVIETDLDRHAFWNPDSADSQLFNSYIGPAVIFEYHDGDYEIVRMNRRFINILQINERIMLPTRGLLRFSPEDAPKFKKAVLEAIYTGKDVTVDFVCILHDGSKRLFHNTLRVMAKCEDRALIFASFGT